MADAFNPYRAWLGVTSQSARPTHYELLGLTAERCDAPLVAEGFRRQMNRLNPHLSGEHAATAQRIASELANARVVLLTPTTKRAYDAELATRSRRAPAAQPPAPSAAAPSSSSGSLSGSGSADDLLPPQAAPVSTPVPVSPVPAAQAPAAPVPASPTSAPPANQPPPPPMPSAYAAPSGAAGYVQPGGYPQGSGQAFPTGAVPTMAPGGYQAPPGYAYGQPYPAQGGYPAQQPVAGQPAYPGQQVYPGPQVFPSQGMPASAAYPAAAPQPAAPVPSVSTGSSTSSVSQLARQKRSSAAPILVGLLVGGVAVAGGAYYLVKAGSAQSPAGPGTNAPANGSAVAANTQPGKTPSVKPGARSSTNSNSIRRKSTKPPVVAPVASSSKNKLFDPNAPDPESPQFDMPVEMSDDGPQPRATASPMPAPQPVAKPAGEAPAASPEEQAAVGEALAAARQALAGRDFTAAETHLAEATLEATAPESLAAVDRLEFMNRYLKDFWDAVRQQLEKLDGAETITVDGKELSIIEASPEKIIFRSAGKRYEYAFAKLPAKLAYWLADSWLDHSNPAAYLVLGAFHALDAQGDRQQARRLFDQAAAGGLDVRLLVAELDVSEGK